MSELPNYKREGRLSEITDTLFFSASPICTQVPSLVRFREPALKQVSSPTSDNRKRSSLSRTGEMANLGSLRMLVLYVFQLLLLMQIKVSCYQYKVGDLDAWGIPTSGNPQIYTYWSKYHNLKIGDSILFLYPPSQDSVIQITEQSYSTCNLKDPILYMNNGNSLFNITTNGDFYFTSGVPGHCEKKQKVHISVGSRNGSSAYSPSYGPSELPDTAPSYPTVFGSIPLPPSSSPVIMFSVILSAVIGTAVSAFISGIM